MTTVRTPPRRKLSGTSQYLEHTKLPTLMLHTAAYWLMRAVRDTIPRPQPLASGEFSTIRLRLLKIAVRIKETASRVRLAFASNCPDAALFRGLVGTLILRPT